MHNRLIELEIKSAYQEDLLQALNATVSEQQQRLMRLENTCQLLNEALKRLATQGGAENQINATVEIPPHY